MKIRVIGTGCPTCTMLYKTVLKLNEEKKIDAEVEYSSSITELLELGVMSSPALVINGEVANVGMPSSEKKLLEIIRRSTK